MSVAIAPDGWIPTLRSEWRKGWGTHTRLWWTAVYARHSCRGRINTVQARNGVDFVLHIDVWDFNILINLCATDGCEVGEDCLKNLQIWQIKLRMFARFVKNVEFFEKSLIQKFLFLCNFKLFLHKINPKSHQTPCQTTVAESGFELKILLIFLNILFSHLVKVY